MIEVRFHGRGAETLHRAFTMPAGKRQGRFRHLFEPKRDDEIMAHIQATVNEDSSTVQNDKNSPKINASPQDNPM